MTPSSPIDPNSLTSFVLAPEVALPLTIATARGNYRLTVLTEVESDRSTLLAQDLHNQGATATALDYRGTEAELMTEVTEHGVVFGPGELGFEIFNALVQDGRARVVAQVPRRRDS